MVNVKELKELVIKDKVLFGIKQVLKNKNKKAKVYVVSDAREETMDLLKNKKIEFETLKKKADVTKELNLGFQSEVFLVK